MRDKTKMTNKRRMMEDYFELANELAHVYEELEATRESLEYARANERGDDYAESY